MTTFVFDFAEGDKDQKDLLGGKGANLAEMTNLGLPVPPGFTITTEACRAYLEDGGEPDGLDGRGRPAPRSPREGHGPHARRRRRPAAGQRALRGEVLDARDDGDGPQHRPQRRVRRGPGAAERGRAVRAWTPTAGCCRCSAPRCSDIDGELFSDALDEAKKAKGTTDDLDLDVDDLHDAGRDVQGADRASTPARRSRRTRASRWTWRSRRSSTRGTPTARCSTAARSASPRTSAPPSTSRRWSSATAA